MDSGKPVESPSYKGVKFSKKMRPESEHKIEQIKYTPHLEVLGSLMHAMLSTSPDLLCCGLVG